MALLRDLLSIKHILIVVFVPIILLPVALCHDGQESSCAYVMMVMAVFWVTEALPINVTALLPVFMFPLAGVMSGGDVAAVFFNSTTLMFTGGMMVAVAIEEWQIHKRLALRIMLLIGSKPIWLMLGLMLTSWFLSMWISNTATTAMMLPIASAILEQLRKTENLTQDEDESVPLEVTRDTRSDNVDLCNGSYRDTLDQIDTMDMKVVVKIDKNGHQNNNCNGTVNSDNDVNSISINNANEVISGDQNLDERLSRLGKGMYLCIAYAANIGGTGTMTGSTPNLVLKGQVEVIYEKLGQDCPLTFGNWLLFGAPTSLVIVVLSWMWLQFYFIRCGNLSSWCANGNRNHHNKVKEALQDQYKKLGKFSFGQIATLIHLLAIAILWITRDMGGSFGWGNLFKDKFIKDSVPAILVGCSLFVFPSSLPNVFCCKKKDANRPKQEALLTWSAFSEKMPWGVIFLLGGGFSMAKASQVSGLSAWIGSKLSSLDHLEPWLLNLVLCFIVAIVTEVTSNTATTSLMLPIIAELAVRIGLDPLYLMFPATLAALFAFMLPVATPPNAIVFTYGDIKVLDMVKGGFILNIIAVLVLVGSNETLGRWILSN